MLRMVPWLLLVLPGLRAQQVASNAPPAVVAGTVERPVDPQAYVSLLRAVSWLSETYQVSLNYRDDDLVGLRARALPYGAPSATAALELLLEDTPLTFRVLSPSRFIIYRSVGQSSDLEARRRDELTLSESSKITSGRRGEARDDATEVRGRVVGEEGQPLIGVSVFHRVTGGGTLTDAQGRFTLPVGDTSAVLRFSYLGYGGKTVRISALREVEVRLHEDATVLAEVVVIGYGAQRKEDLTGAVSTAGMEEVSNVPTTDFSQAVQGKLAGVDIMVAGGRPGEGTTVRIRGSRSINATNDPLIILDGVPFTGLLSDINPGDIAQVTVLKDASATAIYGSRGANGVLLLTTRRGRQGELVAEYNGYYGLTDLYGDIDLMGVDQWAAKRRAAYAFDQPAVTDEAEIFDPTILAALASGSRYDWLDPLYRSGNRQQHQISFRGGGERINFFVSGSYFDETGIVPKAAFQRFTGRVNLDAEITDWLRLGTSTSLASSEQERGIGGKTIRSSYRLAPWSTPFDEDGNLIVQGSPDNTGTPNPLAQIVGANDNDTRRLKLFTQLYAETDLWPGMTYRVNFGYNDNYAHDGLFRSSTFNHGDLSDARVAHTKINDYTLEQIVNYDRRFGDHQLHLTGMFSSQEYRRVYEYLAANDLPYESQRYHGIGTARTITSYGSDLQEWGILSGMLRARWTWHERYLLTVTGRADGSSRLAVGNKWDFFPSAAFAWRLIDEPWLAGQERLSNLKLRLSYGFTGNTGIDPYATQGTLERTVYGFGNVPAFGYGPDQIANPYLGWEKTRTINVGLDFGLFDHRLSGTLEWYGQHTRDILLRRSLPRTSGYEEVLQNVGRTVNRGVELTLKAVPVHTAGFEWWSDLTLAHNRGRIVQLFGREDDRGNEWFIGHPIDVWYDYDRIGIWQTEEAEAARLYGQVPGSVRVRDLNDDGVIDATNDRKVIGTPQPDVTGGWNNRLRYGNLELSLFTYFRIGQTIRSDVHRLVRNFGIQANSLNEAFWTPDNPVQTLPSPQTQGYRTFNGTLNYFDGSFVKLRNVTLAYHVTERLLRRIPVRAARLYATTHNAFIFGNRLPAVSLDTETDNGIVPGNDVTLPRAVVFGLDVSF